MYVSGEKIKEYRKQLGLTQVQLAKRLGITQGTLALYETGKRHPKIETVKRIADALCVRWTDLCEEVDEHTQDVATIEYTAKLKEDEEKEKAKYERMQNVVKIAGYDSLEEAMIGISKIYKLLAGNCEDENSIDKEEMQKRVKDILKAVDYLEKFGDT